MTCTYELRVNGRCYPVTGEAEELLVDVLRDRLGLHGTKKGCGTGDCGACTVLLDGRSVNSCLVLAVAAQGCEITTIEGVATDGQLSAIQQAFIDHGAVQCGYCTPGMVLATHALLAENPRPNEEQIRAGLAGNICRCTGYVRILATVQDLAAGR